MRTLTANATTKAETNEATEPIIILKVEWGGSTGTRYYSERFFTLGSITAYSRILEIGQLVSSMRANHVGMMTSISFKLDDSTGEFKSVIDNINVQRKKATVYQHFDGNAESDLTTLFEGGVSGPIIWNEGDRTFQFTVETNYLADQIGVSIDLNDLPTSLGANTLVAGDGIDETIIGKAWPAAFGTVIKAPAVRTHTAPRAMIVAQNGSALLLENSDRCPQGSAVISIDGVLFSGNFSGNTFNISTPNYPKHQNLSLSSRTIGDVDINDPSVAWLLNYNSVIGMLLHFDFGLVSTVDPDGNNITASHKIVVRVVKQQGRKIWFDRPITTLGGDLVVLTSGNIVVVSKEPQLNWPVPHDSVSGKNFRSIRTDGVITEYRYSYGAGTRLFVWGYSDKYVCNIYSNTSVFAVYAQRHGRLEVVPTNFWSTATITIGGKTGYGINISFPLDLMSDQGWSGGQIWVTFTSVQGGGTVKAAIKHIIETYTGLTVDITSYNAATGIGLANFLLTSVQNAVKVCDELAFQAGLGLSIIGNTVKFTTLMFEQSSILTIAESKVEEFSLQLKLSDDNDLYTKLIASFQEDYVERTYQMILTENTATYGTIEEKYDFFAFNAYGYVYASAYFWLNRRANIWKMVSFSMDTHGLLLEVFDTITLAFSDTTLIGVASTKAIVTSAAYDVKTKRIQIECLLPFTSGKLVKDVDFWLTSSPSGVIPTFTHLIGVEAASIEEPSAADRVDEEKANSAPVPAVIREDVSVPSGYDYIVDLYGDGYYKSDGVTRASPTLTSVPARSIGKATATRGDQVTIQFSNKQAFVGGASETKPVIIARITAEGPAGTYSFKEYNPSTGLDVTGGIIGTAKELNSSTGIVANTIVEARDVSGTWWFFFPVATCT